MALRKHVETMTEAEKNMVYTMLDALIPQTSFHPHAEIRMKQKRIQPQEVVACLMNGEIIEVNNNRDDVRVLLRHEQGNKATCAVFSFGQKEVVTTYQNDATDNHATLDASLYGWNVDLTKAIPAIAQA